MVLRVLLIELSDRFLTNLLLVNLLMVKGKGINNAKLSFVGLFSFNKLLDCIGKFQDLPFYLSNFHIYQNI